MPTARELTKELGLLYPNSVAKRIARCLGFPTPKQDWTEEEATLVRTHIQEHRVHNPRPNARKSAPIPEEAVVSGN